MKHVLLAHLLSIFALTAVQHPSFDVASVKRNDNRSVQPALRYTPSGVDFARVPLNWIIGEAYQIPYYSQTAMSATDSFRELLLQVVLPENPISTGVTGMKPANRKVHMSFVFGLKLKAPPVSCYVGGSQSCVHKPSTPGLTRSRSCIRQPAVRIGDADRRLRES